MTSAPQMTVERAKDVNSRLVNAYFVREGITDGPYPDVSDITAAEARACGQIVAEAEEAERAALPPGASHSMSMVIEAHRAPLYLAYAIAEQVKAEQKALAAQAKAEASA